jgi:transcription termination factor Rho
MELVLNRALAERRVYPAIDLGASGTRKEERLLPPEMLEQITLLRRSMLQMRPVEAMEGLVSKLSKTKSNIEFLRNFSKLGR